MKPTTTLFALFFLFLVAFTTATAEPLIDTDGDIVMNGGKYYLNPNSHFQGSGIIFSPISNSGPCTLAVIDDLLNGGFETFISSPAKIGILHTQLPLNFSFVDLQPSICARKPNWVVTRSSLNVDYPVMVGSAEDFGYDLVHGWFFIKSVKDVSEMFHHYKIVFCEVEKECKNVGVFVNGNNQRQLVVTDGDEPLVFTIRKEWRGSFASDDLSMVV